MNRAAPLWVRCSYAGEHEGMDLFRGRIYQIMPDEKAVQHKQIRVVDESGEDYLYPADWFVPAV